ncbi:50S ribosomal protein L29 [Parachlamydia sp. AcF125]|uniref:50S ribosomal protein L29 n=1 Tax=Parachlamydia sp. AcF125 TaxID=2795736 RepID=UPI001BC8CC8B|nr:50S ribosomal protein L29 [Parachlamydia sp. AcF125]MBS4167446.1 50S ribosomal protein L29 [Parachlamydia sp. AcF125]
MSKARELINQSLDELQASLSDKQKELYALVVAKKNTKKLEKPHRIPSLKKDIARLHTVIHAKTLQEQSHAV